MDIMQARENDAARQLETVWTELNEKNEEVERLRRQGAAAARELKSAQTEARELAATNEDLLRRMDEMVPRSRAQVLERELVACRAEFSSFMSSSSSPKAFPLQSTQGGAEMTLETEIQRCQEELLRSWQEIELRSAEIERLHKLRVADQLQIEALDRLNRRLSDRVKASICNGGNSEKNMHPNGSPSHLSEFSEEAGSPSVQRLC
jgi:hypothetical protein